MRRAGRLLKRLARWALYVAVFVVGLVVALLLAVETGWAKNQIRQLIVTQANHYLNATLQIDRLEGSLLRGVRLSGVTVIQNGEPIIAIDDISIAYSIRELIDQGTSIRRIELARPRFIVARDADGRWNLASLIRRETSDRDRSGPKRPIHLLSIQLTDGAIQFRDPLNFGAIHLPTRFDDVDIEMAFNYEPVKWQMDFAQASWQGGDPALSVGKLTGSIASGADGWQYRNLHVETPKGQIDVDGQLDRTVTPSVLKIKADAKAFDFQEWATSLPVLERMKVTSQFSAELEGPLAQLKTTIALRSNAGDADGVVTLNTTIPGWRFAGAMNVQRLDLAPWLNHPQQPSDISGRVTFDLTLPPGAHFPRGTYRFDGPHVRFMQYEAGDLSARGRLTASEALVEEATAVAYGANVRLQEGHIGIDEPYSFRFIGIADGVDLRRVPDNVPVPHVESTLSFDFDTTGQFSNPFIAGDARFTVSTFLGATVGPGATGHIDTSSMPFTYSGEGDLADVDLHRFGAGLAVPWMQEPRYAGTLAGRFRVEGSGSDAATMVLRGGGRLREARMFSGTLSDAEVTIEIENGTLKASYDGAIDRVDPAIAMDDQRYAARLSGSGRGQVAVHDLLVRSPELRDYDVSATMALKTGTEVRGVAVDRGALAATLDQGILTIGQLDAAGPAIDMSAHGPLALDDTQQSNLVYDIRRANLPGLRTLIGRELSGQLVTNGTMTGPAGTVHLVGEGTLDRLSVSGVQALTTTASYDATVPIDKPLTLVGRIDGHSTFIEGFGQQLKELTGAIVYDRGNSTVDLTIVRNDDLRGTMRGTMTLHPDDRAADITSLSLVVARSSWKLADTNGARIAWNDQGVVVSQLGFTDAATSRQHVVLDGSWYPAGGGSLHIVGTDVALDPFFANGEAPGRFGGTLSADITLTGTREAPLATGTIRIVNGRIWRTAFETFAGRVGFRERSFDVDVRLDQSPGVWLTASGSVPLALFVADEPDRPMDLTVASSLVDLGLLEGITDVVDDVAGQIQVNTRVLGSGKDPHFDGRVDIQNARFRVRSSGSRYKNAHAGVQLSPDRIAVETFHLEDNDGHPLEVSGSLGTHELQVGDLAIDVRARNFEVVRNEFGRVNIDSDVRLRGRFESPRLAGRVTVTGGTLQVDAILDRALFQPYATTAAPVGDDAVAALNPWERLGLDLELRVPGTLRLLGANVQVTPGTPIGLGDINLRAVGDLYLYKDPAQPLYVTGSLDSVTGTYSFQGRRFDLDPASSINFRGDLNPDLYVTVSREISGVQARVTIAGPLREPELRLASTPPLDQSDILSMIVFNTTTNDLSALQQEQLAVRAGTLAAGFLAAPIVTSLERSLGLDTLEIESVSDFGSTGARVTIGNEIAPGLVARFSRNFGEAEYDEATVEYYLSRLFRIRATFSDASSAVAIRSPFRRVERAGIDFLIFLSF